MQINELTTTMESQTASAMKTTQLDLQRRLRTPSALWPLSTRWGLQRVVFFFFSRSNFDNWLRRATFLSVAGTASLVLRAWVCETKFACHALLCKNPRLAWGHRRTFCKIPVLPGGIGLYCKSSQAKTPISPKGNRHATLKLFPMQRPSKEKKLNSIQASLVG